MGSIKTYFKIVEKDIHNTGISITFKNVSYNTKDMSNHSCIFSLSSIELDNIKLPKQPLILKGGVKVRITQRDFIVCLEMKIQNNNSELRIFKNKIEGDIEVRLVMGNQNNAINDYVKNTNNNITETDINFLRKVLNNANISHLVNKYVRKMVL